MLEDQLLGLGIIREDGEPIIMVTSVAPSTPSVLPVLITGQLSLDDSLLPLTNNLRSGLVGDSVLVLQSLLGAQPSVLLENDGLVEGVLGIGVVVDPLGSPSGGLGPPIWVEMEGSVVNVWEGDLGVEVSSVGGRVGPVLVVWEVEFSLGAGGDEMEGVEGLDVAGGFAGPLGDDGVVAGLAGGAGEVAGAVGAAAGLVGELPAENGG